MIWEKGLRKVIRGWWVVARCSGQDGDVFENWYWRFPVTICGWWSASSKLIGDYECY